MDVAIRHALFDGATRQWIGDENGITVFPNEKTAEIYAREYELARGLSLGSIVAKPVGSGDIRKKLASVCPISRKHFKQMARPIKVVLTHQDPKNETEHIYIVPLKDFKGVGGTADGTGSFGWYLNRKSEIQVGGVPVMVQLHVALYVIGSKHV